MRKTGFGFGNKFFAIFRTSFKTQTQGFKSLRFPAEELKK